MPGGVEPVRRLEKYFLGNEGFSAERAISLLVEEAAVSHLQVDVTSLDGWWVLSADHDWLPPEIDDIDSFNSVLPLPERGPNAARSEVVLSAFARTVVTARDGQATVIVESPGTGQWIAAHETKLRSAVRVIAFDV
jgi:hypothetical protein